MTAPPAVALSGQTPCQCCRAPAVGAANTKPVDPDDLTSTVVRLNQWMEDSA